MEILSVISSQSIDSHINGQDKDNLIVLQITINNNKYIGRETGEEVNPVDDHQKQIYIRSSLHITYNNNNKKQNKAKTNQL